MKSYLVGGAVRDALLGLPVKDKDWVVVGATPEAMIDAGYQQVGRDFPVFLHPKSREEYALARTERKSGSGYTGFTCYAAPDVTLEQDLMPWRRTKKAILSTSTAARTICATVFYAIFPPPFLKIRYAYCAWRVLPPVMPISASASPTRRWR